VGAKGPRYYDWALVVTLAAQAGHHWLLIRRQPRCGNSPSTTAFRSRSVSWSARRQTSMDHRGEFSGQQGAARLGEHQLRRWLARCWTLLAILVHALRAVIVATERTERHHRAS
jgi:hypothetical protein